MQKSLYDNLKDYSDKKPLRMHMPGHKGDNSLLPYANMDITEIADFDNLHNPTGIIKDSMSIASHLWGSKQSFFLVNGSTCGILAAIRALSKHGDKVVIARNCHKSVYNAVEICGLNSIYVFPEKVEEWNIFGSITPDSVEELLSANPDVGLVIITSPTYEGVISDIEKIAEATHKKGARLIVDEAHGAHLGLCDFFEKSSIHHGADVVIQSLHKTLACPTQSAILHINDEEISKLIQRQLSIFETSSPSYLLMASIDSFVRRASSNKNLFNEWTTALKNFYYITSDIRGIEILSHKADAIKEIYAYDKSKIVFKGNNNIELGSLLSREYGVEFELVCPDYIIAMTGEGDTFSSLSLFAQALKDAASKVQTKGISRSFIYNTCPILAESSFHAVQREHYSEKVTTSVGKICGEYVWEYPPGIPLLVPGEVIPESFAENMKKGFYSNLHSDSGELPDYITVCK